MRISVLSNVNLDMLSDFLSKSHKVYKVPGFDQWEQICIDTSHSLIVFEPQIIFLFLDAEFLFQGYRTFKEISERIDIIFEKINMLSNIYHKSKIYISNLDFYSKEIKASDIISNRHEIYEIWHNKINALMKTYTNIHYLDLFQLIHSIGSDKFYSAKMLYLASMPYSLDGIKSIYNYVEKVIKNNENIRKKVLIIDLDNTIWGGVIGEDGPNGIILGNSGKGLIYRNTQKIIKSLKSNGIILSIVSKNNYEDVRLGFEMNMNMILSIEDFSVIKCNWEPKSKNILEISKKLNLGTDSFVFLDDNPLEREEVKISLPDITIADFPENIVQLPTVVESLFFDYFFIDKLTNEDLEKTNQYLSESKRDEILKNSSNLDEFIKSLEINVEIDYSNTETIGRISQLTQKTNQFNLRTKRYTIEELNSYLDLGNLIITAKVNDRFGDSGLVFVLMLNLNEDKVFIENLIMSCRVMGKKIENSIMNSVEIKLIDMGFHFIKAQYIPTTKNIPVLNLMESLNYELIDTSNDGVKTYIKDLRNSRPIDILFKSRWIER